MKRFATVATLGVALALAGCGKSDDAGKADGTATADAGASAGTATGPIKREAGNWKTEVKLVKFDMPGAPAAVKDQMAKQIASAGATETCLTPEQADQEDIANAMAKGYGDACTWTKNAIGGGTVDVAGTCTANGQTVDFAMAGTMEPKKTDVTITTKTVAPTGGQMETQMQVTGTNTGPCKV